MQLPALFVRRFVRQLLVVMCGMGALLPMAAIAVEWVDYTASSTFTLDAEVGNPNQDFGSVYIESDSATGWILQVRSMQNGTLQHTSHTSAIAYTLMVDGLQVGSLTSGSDVVVKSTNTLTCPPPGGCTYLVQANILAGDIAHQPSGNYTDTLVFTLTNQ